MVAPVVLALVLLAQPMLLLAEAPRAHQGWLLAEVAATTAAPAPALAPHGATGLRDAVVVATALGVAIVSGPFVMTAALFAGPDAAQDWRLLEAVLLGPPVSTGAPALVRPPTLALDSGCVDTPRPDAPRREERTRPPGPSATEGPVTLAAMTREQPTPGFTVLWLP